MNRIFQKIYHKLYFAFLSLKIKKLPSDMEVELMNSGLKEVHDDLKQKYDQYILEVSSADMAASYECVSLLDRICKWGSYKRLVDFGSGISSVIFRQYAVLDPSVHVWSVEDDGQWIKKTRGFLEKNNLSSENLMTLSVFLAAREENFDMVFLDLNFVDVRKNFIRLSVDSCKSGGIIIFDDVHKKEFMYEILHQTRNLPVQLFNIKHLTLDGFGRFSLLGIKD